METTITLEKIERKNVIVPVVGTTPLITNRFSEKARKQLLESLNKKKVKNKEEKDPVAEYEASIYRLSDGRPGFPAVGFKAAIIGACRHYDSLPMTKAKISIFVHGEGAEQLVPLVGDPEMREDYVRYGASSTDLRYRAMFWPWSASLKITYMTSMLDLDGVIALVDAAGLGGVGEWRPSAPKSSTGSYGMFEVDTNEDIRVE